MDREKAIKIIEIHRNDTPCTKVVDDALCMAIEALEYLEINKQTIDLINVFFESFKCDPSMIKLKDEWIPCSEKLPKENGEYLVTLENGIVKKLGYSTTQRTTYPKGFYYVKDGISWRQTQNPVVAWMPLPEPYKAESEK